MQGLTFAEWLDHVRPELVMFAPPRMPQLSAADMIDQCALVKDLFRGRWPSVC